MLHGWQFKNNQQKAVEVKRTMTTSRSDPITLLNSTAETARHCTKSAAIWEDKLDGIA